MLALAFWKYVPSQEECREGDWVNNSIAEKNEQQLIKPRTSQVDSLTWKGNFLSKNVT